MASAFKKKTHKGKQCEECCSVNTHTRRGRGKKRVVYFKLVRVEKRTVCGLETGFLEKKKGEWKRGLEQSRLNMFVAEVGGKSLPFFSARGEGVVEVGKNEKGRDDRIGKMGGGEGNY